MDRETVARQLRAPPAGSNAALAPLGSGADPGSPDFVESSPEPVAAAAPVPASSRIGRPSDYAPFRAVIVAGWERDLSARRIYQDLVTGHGFAGSYYSVRQLGRRAELPVRRMECEPGDEAQVDFGRGAPVTGP